MIPVDPVETSLMVTGFSQALPRTHIRADLADLYRYSTTLWRVAGGMYVSLGATKFNFG
jgi:hypothetical protein